jgi:5-methylcytosine-specific restriction endonuclease McrA
VSKKQDKIKRQLNKIYHEILLERNSCSGCGKHGNAVPLSFSHIIPRSRRGDLVT